MPDTWIDANGRRRCWSCGAAWSTKHPPACPASCDEGEQFPTTKPGSQINVYGYPVTNRKGQQAR